MSSNHHNAVYFETWAAALASSACIGFTSLVPWLFNMTFFERNKSKKQLLQENSIGDGRMKYLLSFSIGAILGDIFFHLLPESYQSHIVEFDETHENAHRKVGFSVIAGIFMFIIVEMVLEKWSHPSKDTKNSHLNEKGSISKQKLVSNYDQILYSKTDLKNGRLVLKQYLQTINGISENNNIITQTDYNNIDNNSKTVKNTDFTNNNEVTAVNRNIEGIKKPAQSLHNGFPNGHLSADSSLLGKSDQEQSKSSFVGYQIIDPAGYLNLIANGFDNFTHGLAIGASFLIGPKVGLLTTFVIFIHEIPHEICDYAILVNSGFTRLDAVKAQSSVSLFGILGTATALYVKSIETLNAKTVWILPFSAGGFLYIALVNLLPEILEPDADLRSTIRQIGCVVLGIAFMAAVAII